MTAGRTKSWDGFRAIVSTEDGLRVRSRRGWNMTMQLLELADLPAGLVRDGEIIAFNLGATARGGKRQQSRYAFASPPFDPFE